MKTKIVVNGILGATASLGILLLAQSALGQTNLQFTGVNVTDEGNIQFTWASVSNEVYQIQEADTLINTNTGTTSWNLLYDEYPSQGTNTFWLDTGNYDLGTPIVNPKDSPMRFYRILDEGQDGLYYDEPTVSISSPTNGTSVTGELTITVTAATDQLLSYTTFYVDGQEMSEPDSSTNYFAGSTNYEVDTYSINSCEWFNGPHTLFATATSASTPQGGNNTPAVLTGNAVSAFVPVVFSNLVEEISFSQPQFNPSLGQTQQVSAVFAANCDWNLNITDVNSNTVLTASGSGTSMSYAWNGTGTGETNLPPGIYYYYISAETNGESDEVEEGGSGGGGGSPPSPDDSLFDASELWAVAPDSDNAVPFALYPPGFDTNGFTFFSASPSEMSALSSASSSFSPMSGGRFSPDGAGGGGSGAASQNTPATPQRPPNSPVNGVSGTFGIDYQTYEANGSSGFTPQFPDNGLGIGEQVQMEGYGAADPINYESLPEFKSEAKNFVKAMKKGGWNASFINADNQVSIGSLEGSGTPFNQVNLGMLMVHGTYGSALDYTTGGGGCKQMYFPITSGTSSQYLRMSQMNLGGSATNGLEWMGIMACFSLYHANWQSMQSQNVKPYNSNLHLILGCDTLIYTDSHLLQYWAKDMLPSAGTTPMTIQAAWYAAGTKAYSGENYTAAITFSVAGDAACSGDSLQSSSAPSGTAYYNSETVFSP